MSATRILGCGHYLPSRCITNHDLPAHLETDDAWIQERTGITQRFMAAEDEATSDLAVYAARAALKDAGLGVDAVDLIVLATETPDLTMPASAILVQHKLGMKQGAAMDIHAACSGFVYGLATADSLLKQGVATTALVIGAETFSRVVDWQDRTTCILFGDGAGAVVLQRDDAQENRLLAHELHSDGAFSGLLGTTGGVSSTQSVGHLQMKGREVFRHAVQKMGDVLVSACGKAGVTASQLDWIVPHQANARIIQTIAEKYDLPEQKLISTVGIHANTSAASIPLALSAAQGDGRLKAGDLVGLTALGAGFSWGSSILRWK